VILYPAVDILDGRAVRLAQGEFSERTEYYEDPLDAARAWLEAGARALHVVDLDGARAGQPVNLDAIRRIAALAGDVPVQVGGGLRSAEDVAATLSNGASRVVIGTAAYRDPSFLDAAVSEHGARVAVAIDVRDGRVSAAGWTQDTGLDPLDALSRLAAQGVRTFVYTNVDVDGMLTGPDLPADALQARHPVPGRGRRPRGQGHEVPGPARRGRPGRARGLLRPRGRGRGHLP